METKTKKLIKDNLIIDKLIFRKDGTITAKQFYFYTHGITPEKVAYKIIKALREMKVAIKILNTSDKRNAWPQDSWFEVNFQVV